MSEHPTVYLVTSGYYSDYGIDSAWATREEAEARAKTLRYDDVRVEPFYVGLPAPAKDYWRVAFHHQGVEVVEYARTVGRVEAGHFRRVVEYGGRLAVHGTVYCHARDAEHAIKIASERKAVWDAENPPGAR